MKVRTLKALLELNESIQSHMPRIEKNLSKSGAKPEPAVAYSAAKYYETLRRLAND